MKKPSKINPNSFLTDCLGLRLPLCINGFLRFGPDWPKASQQQDLEPYRFAPIWDVGPLFPTVRHIYPKRDKDLSLLVPIFLNICPRVPE